MASIVVPGLDLAPSVPSRIVTVDVIDMTEGAPAAGAKIDFILPQDLHARSDGKVLKAGTTTLELDANGHGEIRVPAYSNATRPDDWVILVKKHWAPYPYPIRVPEGTTKISLATLEPPVEVSDAMTTFVPTDATVRSVNNGAQWGATAEVSGGIINLDFVVPPGGVAYWKGYLTAESNVDTLTVGKYQVGSQTVATAIGLPVATSGTVTMEGEAPGGSQTFESITSIEALRGVWARQRISGVWGAWTRRWPTQIDSQQLQELIPKIRSGANLVKNGDFTATATGGGLADFGAGNATITTQDGKAILQGSSGGTWIQFYQSTSRGFTSKPGHKYFLYTQIKTSNTDAGTALYLELIRSGTISTLKGVYNHKDATRVSIEADRTYTLCGIIEPPTSFVGENTAVQIRANASTSTVTQSRTLTVSPITVLDLTEIYGAGNEPIGGHMAGILEAASGYIPGVSTQLERSAPALLDVRERVLSLQRVTRPGASQFVTLRFDDGYLNNLTVAARILAEYGYRGTLYTSTANSRLGTIWNGLEMLTGGQLLELHRDYNWEIASHTQDHHAVGTVSEASWISSIKRSIRDLVDHGVPAPHSFAYPNGWRNKDTDRILYQNYSYIALTPNRQMLPTKWDEPTVFTGWHTMTSDPNNRERGMEFARRYVESQWARGYNPVLAFHGVTDGPPPADFHMDSTQFREIIGWLHAEGYPVGLQRDMPRHNRVDDPNFTRWTVNANDNMPWERYNQGVWSQRVLSPETSASNYSMRLSVPGGSSEDWIQQFIHVGGEQGAWNIYVVAHITGHTGGGVQADVTYYNVVGDEISTEAARVVFDANTTAPELKAGSFTVPAGAHTARIRVRTSPGVFSGTCDLSFVAAFPAWQYDPLAP